MISCGERSLLLAVIRAGLGDLRLRRRQALHGYLADRGDRHGVVTVKGEPATGGVILFNPSNSGRIVPARTAEIGPDGRITRSRPTPGIIRSPSAARSPRRTEGSAS